ncbi:MAG: autoinducer binding domain-containing protein [Kordiimonadaceae bacterium]|nr:autoinducer binding domain-containing protein [Kordiimonadaceae bacterium]
MADPDKKVVKLHAVPNVGQALPEEKAEERHGESRGESQGESLAAYCDRNCENILDSYNNTLDSGALLESLTNHELQYIRNLSLARNELEFYQCISISLRHMGFSEYSFSRLGCAEELPIPIVTMPKEMNEVYFEHGFYEHDLALQYAQKNDTPIFLSGIRGHISTIPFKIEVIKCSKEAYKLLDSYGYKDFFFIPIRAGNGNNKVMLAVATKDHDTRNFHNLIKSNTAKLISFARAIDFVGTKKYSDVFLGKSESRKIILNPRPLEILRLIGPGDMKLIDAADMLGISKFSASRHISAAKQIFDVQTTTGAVYCATKQGLIDEK